MFCIQAVMRAIIPDIPYDVEVQQQRMDYINRKIIYKEMGTEDDEALIALLAKRSAVANWSKKDEIALNLNSFIKASIDAK